FLCAIAVSLRAVIRNFSELLFNFLILFQELKALCSYPLRRGNYALKLLSHPLSRALTLDEGEIVYQNDKAHNEIIIL
ncbi:hypothetical protein, partial [Riemerella anatipestifer]|uniref:hypothetical protein n=1 Tax=Riemerella anatipestifer TaxID=34085 RepID=UPI001C882DD1